MIGLKSGKGVSPLIASVLLIAFTLAVATLAGPWFSKVLTQSQGNAAEKSSNIVSSSEASLKIISAVYDKESGSTSVSFQNSGSIKLSNFTATVYGDKYNQVNVNERLGPGQISTVEIESSNPEKVSINAIRLSVEEEKEVTSSPIDDSTESTQPVVFNGYDQFRSDTREYGSSKPTEIRNSPIVDWSFDLKANWRGSPTIVNQTVYMGGENGFHAVNLTTGKKLWSYTGYTFFDSGGAFKNGSIYAVSGDGYLLSLDAETGSPNWVQPYPSSANNNIYLDGNHIYGVSNSNSLIYSVYANNGSVRYTKNLNTNSLGIPVVSNNTVYAAGNGEVIAFDVNGSTLWSQSLPANFKGAPLVKNQSLYLTDDSNDAIFSLKTSNGGLNWDKSLNSSNTYVSPVYHEGKIYTSNYEGIFALNATNGDINWFTSYSPSASSPVIVNETLYTGTFNGVLKAFDDDTGKILWTFQGDGGGSAGSPAISKGKIVFPSYDGKLYALKRPGAVFKANQTYVAPGEAIQFNASSSNKDISSYNWDWNGDGNYDDSGLKATHSYSTAGTYTVKLKATWEDGRTDYAGINVTVRDPLLSDWAQYKYDDQNTGSSDAALGYVKNDPKTYSSVTGGLMALNTSTGDRLWNNTADSFTSALYSDGTLIGYQSGKISGVDASNGENIWTYDLGNTNGNGGQAIIKNDTVYSSGDEQILALYESNGSLKWELNGLGYTETSPAYYKGSIYFTTGNGGYRAYRVNVSDKSVVWNRSINDRTDSASPLVRNGKMYTADSSGNVYAYNISDGDKEWKYMTGEDIHSSPTYLSGKIVIATRDGNVYSLNATDGSKIWNKTSERISGGAITASEGKVYTGGSYGLIQALDAEDGGLIWNLSTSEFTSSIIKDENSLYTLQQGYIRKLNESTGNIEWSYNPGSSYAGPAALVEDVLFLSLVQPS